MGIDKPNVRFVVHAAAPRSIENYQQESGRAGRDGLEAECCLLYGPGDFITWKKLQSDLTGEAGELANRHLATMERFCQSVGCRHKALVEHFGQAYSAENCGACDACLDQLELVEEPLILGQKILSCVLRVQQSFGAEYVVQVLLGSHEQRVLDNGHDRLSTYGLLKEAHRAAVRDWIEQLVAQDFLFRDEEYRQLRVTDQGRELLRGQVTPRLLKPATKAQREKTTGPQRSMEGVDVGLFNHLRDVRRELADVKGLPSFVVFSDVTLQDMCRRRPSTLEAFRHVHGVGSRKLEEYGERFVQEIVAYCRQHGLSLDATPAPLTSSGGGGSTSGRANLNGQAADLFAKGRSIKEVAAAMDRKESTVVQHLCEYISQTKRTSPEPWLDAETFARVQEAAAAVGLDRLRPLFEHFGEKVPYEQLHIARALILNQDAAAQVD
jgi:ATP-dependent DNA helicase RecQ